MCKQYSRMQFPIHPNVLLAVQLHAISHPPMCVAGSEGGTSIEDLAEKYPEKIIKIPVDIRTGITDAQALQMAKGLAVTGDQQAAADQIKRLYTLFAKSDCTMVEVGPAGVRRRRSVEGRGVGTADFGLPRGRLHDGRAGAVSCRTGARHC